MTAFPLMVTCTLPWHTKAASAPTRIALSDLTGTCSRVPLFAAIFTRPVFPAPTCRIVSASRHNTLNGSSRRVTPRGFLFCTLIATSSSRHENERDRRFTSSSVTSGSRRMGIVTTFGRFVHNPAHAPGHFRALSSCSIAARHAAASASFISGLSLIRLNRSHIRSGHFPQCGNFLS